MNTDTILGLALPGEVASKMHNNKDNNTFLDNIFSTSV